ncbi:hypothetical protein SLE2022_015000 [Rubroshorea leprosula]
MDLCMFRYSNREIYGVKQTIPDRMIKSDLNVSNVEKFNLVLSSLLNNLSSRAAAGNTFGKYAAGHAAAPNNFGGVYAYAQCSPELSQQECGKGKSDRTSPMIIIIVIVASVVGVLLLLLCIWICLKLRKSKEKYDNEIIKIGCLQYDLRSTIQAATNNLCDKNILGQGGYGVVYKGQLLNGQFVAVKRLSCGSEQGDREFKNEVLLMAKL